MTLVCQKTVTGFLFPSASGLFLRAAGHDVILAELVRRHADVFGKLQIEIALRIITDHLRDASDGQIRGDEQRLRLSDPAAQQILHWRVAAHPLPCYAA